VHENSTGAEFRFVTPGPKLSGVEWQTCLDQLMAIDPWPAFIVASGSLPPGVPVDFYARLSKAACRRGSRLVLDSSGPALIEGLNSGVFLVKPSLRELSEWFGQSLTTQDQWQAAAKKLLNQGHAEVVVVSLGAQGAMMVSHEGTVVAPALAIEVVSAVAAGDTLLGAMVHALTRKMNLRDALALGLACASAALLSHGHCLFEKTDLDRLLGQVCLQEG
jgi:6-phosphofructokinase 2